MDKTNGIIYLIGAGPGDPGLITVKAVECIKAADVVVYDYLASPTLLSYAKPGAEIIYVGKKGGDHTLTQDKISELLAQKGEQGHVVARLKGGDPFIFGRGGEEAEVLIERNISFEVVPGVTSAVAAPAYAGIPLTHRDYTSSVSLITGHEDPLKETSSIHWDCLAKSGSTLVFFMGVKNLPNIVNQLLENGKSSQTPVALVRWGTTTRQQTVSGTLSNIVEKVKEAKLKSPAIIVVGEVVSLRENMKWFENRPLFGKKIVVTRARAQASGLVDKLRHLGAHCIEIPTIKVVPPRDNTPLEDAVSSLEKYEWIIFTSVNGVKHFFNTLFAKGLDVRVLGRHKFACIGPVTRDELGKFGIVSDVLPKTYRAESVVEAFKDAEINGKKILLPRAMEARTILPEELRNMGAHVHEVTAYETQQVSTAKEELMALLRNGEIDMVTFTSSSTVKNFMALIPEQERTSLLSDVLHACIGPITEDTAVSLGLAPEIVADSYTIDGLVDVIVAYYTGKEN
ncbi:uroporphyrinogen III methyltransferase / synthase [Desulfocicer vacuolatum DSM 3385]|uniref:uroporphyrinogen-III C-methyltransferase n=1 Tax=Desulfocicer vacuolatum DSM 3385 TaxID=1121400 RepID=A0A1W1YHU4_9BACT|nr:uroporphyrinogen-III C-methyltransferase [Desulfocicer vacuolatum]SMC35713.1 uroporphyrinogen III methyltransferase / synthase [Desulfocicer vacuolatum DSM 3385]